MDNETFINEMMVHKGKVEQSLSDICTDIKEIKAERTRHSDKFWQEITKVTDSLHAINSEVQVMKGKATVLAGLIAFFTSIIIGIVGFFIRGKN